MNENESEWLVRAQKGDDQAFARLVELYQRPVYNLCYRMLGNPGDAEDAAQETFLRAYKNLRRYDSDRPFATWLLSIASHFCIDQLRKRRAQLLSIEGPLPAHPALMSENTDGPEEQATASERQERVQQLLDTLPDDYKQAVVLRYWYDMSYEEIAEVMESSVSAIKSRLFRARRQMAEVGTEEGFLPQLEQAAVV